MYYTASRLSAGRPFFFAKEPSDVEVLNDTNAELINFYRVLKTRFIDLEKMVSLTLHSRSSHRDASVIYNNPHLFSEVQRAWALWVQSTQGFCSQLDNSWGYDRSNNTTTKKIINNRDRLTIEYAQRLQNVQLESTDALYVIQSRDSADSFFYCDPPYINSDCGHYDSYTEDDYSRLLQVLKNLKGKFLLSSYPSPILNQFIKRNGWFTEHFEQGVTVANKSGCRKRKVEVLTRNYEL